MQDIKLDGYDQLLTKYPTGTFSSGYFTITLLKHFTNDLLQSLFELTDSTEFIHMLLIASNVFRCG